MVKPSTPKPQPKTIAPLKIHIDNSVVVLQPRAAENERVTSLWLDLKAGKVEVRPNQPALPPATPLVLGVLGVIKLGVGSVLAVITKARRVSGPQSALYHIQDTQLITHEAVKSSPADLRYAALLQQALDAKELGAHMYFSVKSCMTLSAQRQHQQDKVGNKVQQQNSKPPTIWGDSYQPYVWNTALMQPLLDAGAHAFAVPVMVGYVGQVQDVPITCQSAPGKQLSMEVTLITRLDKRRAGSVAWMAGCDQQGCCAHMAETELRITIQEGPTPASATDQLQPRLSSSADPLAPRHPLADQNNNNGNHNNNNNSTAGNAAGGSYAAGGGGDGSRNRTYSLVLLRGSPPLLFSAPPDLSLNPAVKLCPDMTKQTAAMAAHVKELQAMYHHVGLLHVPGGSPSDAILTRALCVAASEQRATPTTSTTLAVGGVTGQLCLVGSENRSETAAAAKVEQLVQGSRAVAGGTARQLLDDPPARRTLLAAVEEQLIKQYGSFKQAGSEVELQRGALRLSCPGSLDLTNLLQAEVCERWLEGVLTREGVMSEGQILPTCLPALASALRTLWGNQGSVLADQVGGIRCASAGVIADGGRRMSAWSRFSMKVLRLQRYYSHCFSEAERQDVLDIGTGAFRIDVGVKPPGRPGGGLSMLQLAIACIAWGAFQLVLIVLFASPEQPAGLGTVMYYGMMPIAAGAALLSWVWWQRHTYVSKPLLAMSKVAPWEPAAM